MNPLNPAWSAWWETRDGEPPTNDERRDLDRLAAFYAILGLVVLTIIVGWLEPHFGLTAGMR